MLAGNFNMTNSPELFKRLVEYGLHPVGDSDTQVALERIGYCLDLEHRHLRSTMGPGSFLGLDGRALVDAVAAVENQSHAVNIGVLGGQRVVAVTAVERVVARAADHRVRSVAARGRILIGASIDETFYENLRS